MNRQQKQVAYEKQTKNMQDVEFGNASYNGCIYLLAGNFGKGDITFK